jgi:multiple sugar transport system substrate-binding protein
MFRNVNRRSFLAGAGASVIALATASGAKADVGLRFAWWGGQSRAERTQKVVDLYASKHPGITVSTEYLGWGDYWPKLTTEVSGGNAPDLLQMSSDYLADYASRGVLLPLETLKVGALDISDFDPKLLGNGQINGSQYAVPSGVNAVALVVDKTAFDEAGVAAPTRDTTWAEFGTLMADFARATQRSGMVGTPDASGLGPVLETWLRQRNKSLYEPDGTPGFDAGDIGEWFKMWADMRAAGGVASPDVQALDHGDVDNSLLSLGKAALGFQNSNQYVASQALVKDELILAPYPRVDKDSIGGLYVKPTMFYSLSAKSAHVEEAAALLNFILRDAEAVSILGFERGIPGSEAAREALRPSLDESNQVMVDYVAGLGDLAGELPPPEPAGGGEVLDALLKASQEVAFGEKSPEAGGTDFVDAAKAILSRAG